jgi:nuclear RNA export factor
LLTISQSRVEGDTITITVSTDDVRAILRLNGYEFGGISVKIEVVGGRAAFSSGNREPSLLDKSPEIRDKIKAALDSRYNPQTKILDLSNIGQDKNLNEAGFKALAETGTSVFFECIMKVCDEVFKTREQKEQAIAGITVANNGMKEFTPIFTLATTFPDLKALDLSNNQIASMDNLSRMRFKYKKLEHIVLTNNPIELNDIKFKRSLANMFPALLTVDNEPLPAEARIKPTQPKVNPAIFRDDSDVAKNFITLFYDGFDNNRAALAQYYYDADSKFSYAINMKGLRDPSEPKLIPKGEWSDITRGSRNLAVLNNPHAKIERLNLGLENITKAFGAMPATRHPPLSGSSKWLFECSPLQGLPDPTGASPAGVNGLRLTVHGEYVEVESQKRRSFDRTFILGAGGPNGVRVLNDVMTIRGYGGSSAFQPDAPEPEVQVVQEAAVLSEEQQKQALVIELSKITGMNLHFSEICMEQSGWVPMDALEKFNISKASNLIPTEAFMQ